MDSFRIFVDIVIKTAMPVLSYNCLWCSA